jgi:hypothetical protein
MSRNCHIISRSSYTLMQFSSWGFLQKTSRISLPMRIRMTGVIRQLLGPQARPHRQVFGVLLMSLHQPRLLCRISLPLHRECLFVCSSKKSNFHIVRPFSPPNIPTKGETIDVLAQHTESTHHETMAALRKQLLSIPLNHAQRPGSNVSGFTRLNIRPNTGRRDPTNFEDCYISDQDHRHFQT